MRSSASPNLDNIDTFEDFKRQVTKFTQDIAQIVNNNLSYADNFNAQIKSAIFTAPNTDLLITHTLGRVPSGYHLLRNSSGMVIYDGSVSASVLTKTSITLRATVAGTASILIF